jgi:hypothetical protein
LNGEVILYADVRTQSIQNFWRSQSIAVKNRSLTTRNITSRRAA